MKLAVYSGAFFALFAGNCDSVLGIDSVTLPDPLYPGYNANLGTVSGTWNCPEPMVDPSPWFLDVTADVVHVGRMLENPAYLQDCWVPALSSWTYSFPELNWPTDQPPPEEVTFLFYPHWELEDPVAQTVTVEVPNASTQFLYISERDGWQGHIFRTDQRTMHRQVGLHPDMALQMVGMDGPDAAVFYHQKEYQSGGFTYISSSIATLDPNLNQLTNPNYALDASFDFISTGSVSGGDDVWYYSGTSIDRTGQRAHFITVESAYGSADPGYIDHYLQTPPGQLGVAGGRAFLSLPSEDRLLILDGPQLEGDLSVAGRPHWVHQSRSRDQLIVASENGSISLVDPVSLSVRTSLPLSTTITSFTNTETARRYYGVGADGRLYSIDSSSLEIETTEFSKPVIGVASNWANQELYVLLDDEHGSELLVLVAGSLRLEDRIPLGFRAAGIGEYSSRDFYSVRPEGVAPVPIDTLNPTTLIFLALLLLGFGYRYRTPWQAHLKVPFQ
ncbi:MAG: hypothetical protein DHS20C11_25930 [Lysobacteraceae bacterium]|nr:MAG: hypothetical protein DHS20C11_25930 [Xanthomonadaceae bacterium]